MFLQCWHKEVVFKTWKITFEWYKFFNFGMDGILVVVFNLLICICTFGLDPHKSFHVEKEPTLEHKSIDSN
jgi:hypothetical protein